MPRYVYNCSKCNGNFVVVHGMTEDYSVCELCSEVDCVHRIPQMPSIKVVEKQAGQIVREYIEDAKDELKKEKNQLETKEYKPL